MGLDVHDYFPFSRLVEGDVLADTGPYSYGIAFGERDLKGVIYLFRCTLSMHLT